MTDKGVTSSARIVKFSAFLWYVWYSINWEGSKYFFSCVLSSTKVLSFIFNWVQRGKKVRDDPCSLASCGDNSRGWGTGTERYGTWGNHNSRRNTKEQTQVSVQSLCSCISPFLLPEEKRVYVYTFISVSHSSCFLTLDSHTIKIHSFKAYNWMVFILQRCTSITII